MARVIVVTSGKGGVGKTTTTSNIGMSLARLGHSTLLIDADVGLRNLDLLLGLENRIIYTGLDVLKKTCRLEQAIIQDKRQAKLAFFPLSSNRSEVPITSDEIKELINLIKADYEYILIDSPAGIDNGFQTAIECANEAIVVVTPEVPSIRDADRVIGILMSKGIEKINLIINRIRPNMVRTDDMMSIEDVTNILGINLVGVIPDSEKIIIASNRGEPIVLEDKNCLPGIAFDNTARSLKGEKVSLLNLEKLNGKNPVKRILGKLINRSSS
jgi:septum site-determining protein MinD|tara:strand:+ start:2049 stop:2861 length:813 start_codon:yes stop_codon:yes gene_type:complete